MNPATNVNLVFAYNTGNFKEAIGVNWDRQLDVTNVIGYSIIINNITYTDTTTGYVIFPNVVSSVICDASQFGGFATKNFICVIRTILKDKTYIDSEQVIYVCPDSLINLTTNNKPKKK